MGSTTAMLSQIWCDSVQKKPRTATVNMGIFSAKELLQARDAELVRRSPRSHCSLRRSFRPAPAALGALWAAKNRGDRPSTSRGSLLLVCRVVVTAASTGSPSSFIANTIHTCSRQFSSSTGFVRTTESERRASSALWKLRTTMLGTIIEVKGIISQNSDKIT